MYICWCGLEFFSMVECDCLMFISNYGVFIVEFFECGFGIIIGNSFCCVFFFSLEGSVVM